MNIIIPSEILSEIVNKNLAKYWSADIMNVFHAYYVEGIIWIECFTYEAKVPNLYSMR
jgi:hypothetical protein